MINSNLKKRIFTSLTLFIGLVLIFFFKIILIYTLILIGILAILEFLNLTRKIFNNRFTFFLINFVFINYIFLFCILFFNFSIFLQVKLVLYFILIGCIASDIGGFVFGKMIKGPKLTKISPNKTIAGAFGSLIFTFIILSIINNYYDNDFTIKILILAIATSLACQLGDLFFSYIKRKSRIKDTGNILPGHGGILDRIDGILVGLPVGFITLILLKL